LKDLTFFSPYAGTPWELLELVLQTFFYMKSGRIQWHFKRLGNQPETKDKRAHCSIKHSYLVGSSETTREIP